MDTENSLSEATVLARAALSGVARAPGSAKPDAILNASGIRREFGGIVAVDVEHVEIQRGSITALIGPNGAGKTTLFNLLTGFDKPNTGSWTFNGVDEADFESSLSKFFSRIPLLAAFFTFLGLVAPWLYIGNDAFTGISVIKGSWKGNDSGINEFVGNTPSYMAKLLVLIGLLLFIVQTLPNYNISVADS